MTQTILHIASHNSNIGDAALVRGTQATLSDDASCDLEFINHDTWDFSDMKTREFGSSYISWINRTVALTLVGGGGYISRRASINGHALRLPLTPEHVKKLRRPIVLYALGQNTHYGEKLGSVKPLVDLVEAVSQRGLVSVRNDGSIERLYEEAPVLEQFPIYEIPDPGVFVSFAERRNTPNGSPPRGSHAPEVILQVAGDHISRFSSAHRADLLVNLAEFIYLIHHAFGARVTLMPHIWRDIPVMYEIYALAEDLFAPRYLEHKVISLGPLLRGGKHLASFVDVYERADLVVAMRGHAVKCAVGLGTPVVGFDSHPKIRGFLRHCGLERWVVSPLTGSEELFQTSAALLSDSTAWNAARSQAVAEMHSQRIAFHKKINNLACA